LNDNILAVLAWGFVVGAALVPAIKYGSQAFVFLFAAAFSRLVGGSPQTIDFLSSLLGTSLAIAAFSGFVVGGGWLLGMVPLRGAYPLWALAALTGAVVARLFVVGLEMKRKSG